MKISEAAATSGCHLETIRYYERIDLMPRPERTDNGYRVYREREVDRLRFISRGRELGFSLEEIRSLLLLEHDVSLSCDQVDKVAKSHLAAISGRIAELTRIANELQHTIDKCAGGERDTCTILQALRHPVHALYHNKVAITPAPMLMNQHGAGKRPQESGLHRPR